jgi:hypothetical protein
MEKDRLARDQEPVEEWGRANLHKKIAAIPAVETDRDGVEGPDRTITKNSTEFFFKRRHTMPRGDGTGPMGMGQMTGRATGYCAGYAMPGFMNPTLGRGRGMGYGRGAGRGFGRGMGWGRGWAAPAYPADAYPVPYASATAPQNEVELLKSQAKYFGEALEEINKRITELEKGTRK